MALTFGAALSDRVDYGTGASMDNLDPWFFLCWCFPTSFINLRRLFVNGAVDAKTVLLDGNSGNIRLFVRRGGSNTDFITNDTPLTLNAWNFVACTFTSSGAAPSIANIYVGSLTSAAVESTYGTSNSGSGALDDDTSLSFILGNRPSNFTTSFIGDIAVFIYGSNAGSAGLTLDQIRSWQFQTRQRIDGQLFSYPGFNGTGTQADWSGNTNNGTVTGATQADHAPLGPPFGFDLGWQGAFTAAVVGAGFPGINVGADIIVGGH